MNRALQAVTRGLALAGGAFLIAAAIITVVSVAGRYAFGAPVPGDYELVEIACAVGIFMFFPYTHAVGGNISADFFTTGLSERHRSLLDIANDVVFALVALLLTWRLAAGLAEKYASGETSILIGVPVWWSYVVAVASMALLAIVCVLRVVAGIGALRR
jgi:TRAP-type C4-dicarboxylate transport system permease small subunit